MKRDKIYEITNLFQIFFHTKLNLSILGYGLNLSIQGSIHTRGWNNITWALWALSILVAEIPSLGLYGVHSESATVIKGIGRRYSRIMRMPSSQSRSCWRLMSVFIVDSHRFYDRLQLLHHIVHFRTIHSRILNAAQR